jgi:hypothetical protein
VVQSPALVAEYGHRRKQVTDTVRKGLIARRRVIDLVQFRWEATEIMDRQWRASYPNQRREIGREW